MKLEFEFEADAVIVLVGAMGTGKSSFAKNYFLAHDVVATDDIRKQLTGDFKNQHVNHIVFDILDATMRARIKFGLLTVIDSTGTGTVIQGAHKFCREFHRPLYFLVFSPVPEDQLTGKRMAHRMHVLDIYNKQVARIKATTYPKDAQVIYIPVDHIYRYVNVKIKAADCLDSYSLPTNMTYMIIPDLHGAYDVIERVIRDTPKDIQFIALGDIVDRGSSSYKTFCVIDRLRKEGRLHVVISNHDNKFYRWCKKYIAQEENPNPKLVNTVSFDMRLGEKGLKETVYELLSLDKDARELYAHDFIKYYEAAAPVLKLERDNVVNIFAHAGVTEAVFSGRRFSKADISGFLYQRNEGANQISELVTAAAPNGKNHYVIHVGHNFNYGGHTRDKYETSFSNDARITLVEHDIGLGKRPVPYTVEFMIV